MPASPITLQRITRLVKSQAFAHAYLVVGPLASDPNDASTHLIRLIQCDTHRNCGACTPCRLGQSDQYPDAIQLVPSEGSALKVSDIRAMENRIQYGPTQGPYLTVWIPNAHRLTASASNALLKTLESPPDGVIFCLSSSAEAGVLPTITSRCLPIRCCASAGTTDTASKLAAELDVKRPETLPTFNDICQATMGQRLAWGHPLSHNRDTLQIVLMTWLEQARESSQSNPSHNQIRQMDLLVENILNLRYNPNSRLHLDQLLLMI